MAPLGHGVNVKSGRSGNTTAIGNDEELAMHARDECLTICTKSGHISTSQGYPLKPQEDDSRPFLGMFGVGLPVEICHLSTFRPGAELGDPCIFLRYSTQAREDHDKLQYAWSIIPKYSTQLHDTLLHHTSPIPPFHELDYRKGVACLGVSSSVFVMGGVGHDSLVVANVASTGIDTKTGKFIPWVAAPNMQHPRLDPAAVCLFNGEIVVLGGSPTSAGASFVEVLGVKRDYWIPMNVERPQGLLGTLTAHAIRDPDRQLVLFHDCNTHFLYEYDVSLDRCFLRSSNLGGQSRMKSTALIGGILYYMDECKPGALFGLDVNNPDATQQLVTLHYPLNYPLNYPSNEDVCWVPQSTWKHEQTHEAFLVGLGENRLAMVWSLPVSKDLLCIWCTKWHICKDGTKGGELEFHAYATLRTRYYALASRLYDCIPLTLYACKYHIFSFELIRIFLMLLLLPFNFLT